MTKNVIEEKTKTSHVIIAAGPNGSGKSTIVNQHFLENPASRFYGEYINADEIAKTLEAQISDYRERNIRAAGIAEQRRIEAIKEGRSFAFETVMSTPEKVALMTQAKANGYDVSLIFITTDDPEKNVLRVTNRVMLGGHHVQEDAIRKRYHSAMNLLACAIDHADYALIIDNSAEDPLNVAIKENRQLTLHNTEQTPQWVTEKLVKPYEARQASRKILEEVFTHTIMRADVKALAYEADASHDKHYQGKIVGLTNYHALQQIDASLYILHDRTLMATKNIQIHKEAIVQYAYDKGKIRHVINPISRQRQKQRKPCKI